MEKTKSTSSAVVMKAKEEKKTVEGNSSTFHRKSLSRNAEN